MTETDWAALAFKCSRTFSPSAPVNSRDLFAGRIPQILRISEAVNVRGRHAILFGDRGVGKTSLVNILRHLLTDLHTAKVVKVNCSAADTFESVWAKAMNEIEIIQESPTGPATDDEGRATHQHERYTLNQFMANYTTIGPSEIGKVLQVCCNDHFEYVFVFDEFDRLDSEHRRLFADTIKDMSDNGVNATVILVGVAQDVTDLIAEHRSIERNLTQIPMPPMDHVELGAIIQVSTKKLGMTIDKKASDLIISLSNGYPHYTHVLGMESAKNAISSRRLAITSDDTSAALRECISQTQQSVRDDYYKASEGQRKNTLYPMVLMACAMTTPDMMGYFRSIDVKAPLSRLLNRDVELGDFSVHMDKFSSDVTRGPILERRSTSRLYRYKFKNPMLRPYIIMRGIQEGTITGTLLETITVLQPERKLSLLDGIEDD